MEADAPVLDIYGPIRRDDLPGLYARACRQLTDRAGQVLELQLPQGSCDAVVVDAMARLALAARRHRCAIKLGEVSDELSELIELAGLAEVFL
jgi:ABC-type transporter Mla MlaB component